MFVDLADLKGSRLARRTRMRYAVIAFECLSGQLYIIASRYKNIKNMQKAFQTLLQKVKLLQTIYTDRETSLTSSKFQNFLQSLQPEQRINYIFLKQHNKSFFAESYIRHIKAWT